MAKFNLLSKEYKNSFKDEVFSRMFLITTVFALFWTFVFSTTLISGIYFLDIQNKALEESIASTRNLDQVEEAERVEQNILNINQLLSRAANIQEEKSHSPVMFLGEVSAAIPDGVYITTYSFDSRTSIILINGSAESLPQYNLFVNSLEENELFEEIEDPISNLIDPSKFKLTLYIKETTK